MKICRQLDGNLHWKPTLYFEKSFQHSPGLDNTQRDKYHNLMISHKITSSGNFIKYQKNFFLAQKPLSVLTSLARETLESPE